LIKRRSKAN